MTPAAEEPTSEGTEAISDGGIESVRGDSQGLPGGTQPAGVPAAPEEGATARPSDQGAEAGGRPDTADIRGDTGTEAAAGRPVHGPHAGEDDGAQPAGGDRPEPGVPDEATPGRDRGRDTGRSAVFIVAGMLAIDHYLKIFSWEITHGIGLVIVTPSEVFSLIGRQERKWANLNA